MTRSQRPPLIPQDWRALQPGLSRARQRLAGFCGSFLVVALLAGARPLAAGEALAPVLEEELFSDPGAVVESSRVVERLTPEKGAGKSLAISGEARGVVEHTVARGGRGGDEALAAYVLGKFYLDARLPGDAKYFGNIEARNDATAAKTEITLRESFLDFTLQRRLYLRFGKQFLQWGRCFLWNPTDLINIERKTFVQKIASPEGTFGVRLHAPFETRYNFYGFADLHAADDPAESALAGKFEFLLGRTEMAFSLWNRKDFHPVYGYDFSTRLFGLDLAGEAAFSRGDNRERISEDAGTLSARRDSGGWVPRASLNVGRSFDVREIRDRIRVQLELYYNGGGDTDDVFGDERIYAFQTPVVLRSPAGGEITLTQGTRKVFLLARDLYRPNDHSRRYAALFTSCSRFVVSDLTLLVNFIQNLDDGSGLLATGLSYQTIRDFTAGLNAYFPVGRDGREYTFAGTAAALQLSVGLAF